MPWPYCPRIQTKAALPSGSVTSYEAWEPFNIRIMHLIVLLNSSYCSRIFMVNDAVLNINHGEKGKNITVVKQWSMQSWRTPISCQHFSAQFYWQIDWMHICIPVSSLREVDIGRVIDFNRDTLWTVVSDSSRPSKALLHGHHTWPTNRLWMLLCS